MIVEKGNKFRKGDPSGPRSTPFTLTEEIVVTGGNFVLCRVENVGQLTIRGEDLGDRGGAFPLTVEGGNVRGLYVNGVKLDSYVWRKYGSLEKAVEILEFIRGKAGDDGEEAWLWTVQYIFDNPTTTNAEWSAAYEVWAGVSGSSIDSTRVFVKLRDRFFPGLNFNAVRDEILTYDFPTWAGEETQLLEEYS